MNKKISGKQWVFLLLSVMFIGLSACNEVPSDTLPSSAGETCKILVISDNQIWKSSFGDNIRAHFNEPFPWINQSEPHFDVVRRSHQRFENHYLFFRNILVFRVLSEVDEVMVNSKKNVWAQPQLVVEITGPDQASIEAKFNEIKDALFVMYNKNETNRLASVMNRISQNNKERYIHEAVGLHLAVPESYYIAKNQENFIWVRKVIKSKEQETAYLVTTVEYSDTNQLKPEYILSLRDSLCKEHVMVQNNVSYMGTEYRFGPESKVIDFKGYYAVETRGFWKTYGTVVRGGAFLNYMIHDGDNNRLIMIDLYVSRPNENKRNLIKQLEGIAYTLKTEVPVKEK